MIPNAMNETLSTSSLSTSPQLYINENNKSTLEESDAETETQSRFSILERNLQSERRSIIEEAQLGVSNISITNT